MKKRSPTEFMIQSPGFRSDPGIKPTYALAMEMNTYQHEELGQLTHLQITKGELPNGN